MKIPNPTMDFGLSERALNSLRTYFAGVPEVEQVILYGSRARGDHHTGSDIDFMLIGSGITPRLLSRMDMEIDDLLLPWFIQITDRKEIRDAAFLEVVEKEGVVFWERGE
jgi:predicted nucleotidyltransferase